MNPLLVFLLGLHGAAAADCATSTGLETCSNTFAKTSYIYPVAGQSVSLTVGEGISTQFRLPTTFYWPDNAAATMDIPVGANVWPSDLAIESIEVVIKGFRHAWAADVNIFIERVGVADTQVRLWQGGSAAGWCKQSQFGSSAVTGQRDPTNTQTDRWVSRTYGADYTWSSSRGSTFVSPTNCPSSGYPVTTAGTDGNVFLWTALRTPFVGQSISSSEGTTFRMTLDDDWALDIGFFEGIELIITPVGRTPMVFYPELKSEVKDLPSDQATLNQDTDNQAGATAEMSTCYDSNTYWYTHTGDSESVSWAGAYHVITECVPDWYSDVDITATVAPEPPVIDAFTSISSTGMRLNWTPVCTTCTTEIKIKEAGGTYITLPTNEASGVVSKSFAGTMTPDTQYCFKLVSIEPTVFGELSSAETAESCETTCKDNCLACSAGLCDACIEGLESDGAGGCTSDCDTEGRYGAGGGACTADCEPCSAGYYRVGCGGSSAGICVPCNACGVDARFKADAGTWDSECGACTTCGANHYTSTACQTDTDTVCSACPGNSTSTAGSTSISDCTCDSGFVKENDACASCGTMCNDCTSSEWCLDCSDESWSADSYRLFKSGSTAVCVESCPDNYYSTALGEEQKPVYECYPCDGCPIGTYRSGCNDDAPESPGECVAPDEGFFVPTANMESPLTCSVCGWLEREVTPCNTNNQDVVCGLNGWLMFLFILLGLAPLAALAYYLISKARAKQAKAERFLMEDAKRKSDDQHWKDIEMEMEQQTGLSFQDPDTEFQGSSAEDQMVIKKLREQLAELKKAHARQSLDLGGARRRKGKHDKAARVGFGQTRVQ